MADPIETSRTGPRRWRARLGPLEASGASAAEARAALLTLVADTLGDDWTPAVLDAGAGRRLIIYRDPYGWGWALAVPTDDAPTCHLRAWTFLAHPRREALRAAEAYAANLRAEAQAAR